MAEYENNHFVPQLNLRRYGEKINRYNLKEKEYIPNGNIKKAFSEKNLYPLEIELTLKKVEGRYGDILNNKILKAEEELILSREEIWDIKKFLALLMFRVPSALKEREIPKDKFNMFKSVYDIDIKEIPNESYKEYVFRTIKVIAESNNIEELSKNPNLTLDAIRWMMLYNNCYITVWDSKKCGEDFIITDLGMTCEHEKTRFAFENEGIHEELIKQGFIMSKLQDPNISEEQKMMYFAIMQASNFVGANYYMFATSETRMVGLINSWYRMFFDHNKIECFGGVPDVYPCMLSKDAIEANTNNYLNIKDKKIGFMAEGEYDKDDQYIYKIKDLSFEDVCIINCMMLDRADEVIGFVDAKKINKSLNIYTNLVVKLNNYNYLKDYLFSLGYDFKNTDKMKSLADRITRYNFTENDWKYINLMRVFIKQTKGVKI